MGRLLNYLLVPLFTRAFLPQEYGVVTELYAYAVFLIVLLTYGMETGFFRFAEKNQDTNKVFSTSFISILGTTGLFLIIAFAFGNKIAELLQYADHKEYITWFAVIISFDVLTALPFAKLRKENKAKKFAIFKILNILINISLNLFFLVLCKENPDNSLSGFHIPELSRFYDQNIGVGYIFISNLVASAFTLLFFIPSFFKIKFVFSKELIKKMLWYSLPLLVAGMAGMVNEVLDRVLLKYLLEAPEGVENRQYVMTQIGIYGANYKLSILMTLFIQAFRYAAEPLFFSMKSNKDAKANYAEVMTYFVIFGLFIFLSIMMYIDIAKLFIGSKYHEGIEIVPILLIANLFLGIVFNLSFWYKLSDKTIYGTYLAVFGAAITLILNFLLIPILGYVGSAWATLACYFSMMLASYFLGRKHYKIPYNIKKILMYFGFALLLYFVSILLNIQNQTVKYLFNTLILLSFLAVVFYVEKIWVLIKSKK